jgi:hypothetical protein
MTAATPAAAESRLRPAAPRLVRLLRLELRHNAMAMLLPFAVGLFWLTTYRKDMAMPPLWNLRAAGLQSGAVSDFAVPVTGAAAWMASREARRRVTDQVETTARPRWARLLAPWAATTVWALAAYLGCVAVLYGVTAHQVGWGGPLWWPAIVAAASLPAFSALGFVAGTFLPSRFTAPLAAIAAFFLLVLGTDLIHGGRSAWQITPIVTGPWDMGSQGGVATFYPFVPDLSVAQVMFLAAVTVALLGLLVLPAGSAARAVRVAAACLSGTAVVTAVTAVGLAGTGAMDANGMITIPAVHDAADDRPLRFTPACGDTAIPVCLNPAYAGLLPATSDALAPLLGQLAGLPGAPDRIMQEAVTYQQDTGNGIRVVPRNGPRDAAAPSTAHLVLPAQLPGPPMTVRQMTTRLEASFEPALVARVIGDGPSASPAQNAVAGALLKAAGLRDAGDGTAHPGSARSSGPDGPDGPDGRGLPDVAPGTPAYAASERFAALPAPARHTWLVQHLAALRAGLITPAQIP